MIMKLNSRPGDGNCPDLSLTKGNTEPLVRFTPNMVSLETALTKENGPLPSSVGIYETERGNCCGDKLARNQSK